MFWIVTQSLLSGLATTFEIFILTLIFALPLGLILAFGLLSKFTPLKRLVQILVWIIRGTPLMLQLIIIFYGPGLWLHKTVWSGNETGRITATVVAFVINYACYFSVPAGQREAGQVLGMTKHQIFFKITLLQMIKRVVPPMSNEIITLVKDTSLASTIMIGEMFRKAQEAAASSLEYLWIYIEVALIYLLFCTLLTGLQKWIEKKLRVGK